MNIIVDYKNKNVVVRSGCTPFQAVDKSIAQTRIWEKKFHLPRARSNDDQSVRRQSMSTVLGFSLFGVDWQFVKPFIVIGLAFGGVYALSGVGLVVLYRATGVLNVAFGAIGAAGALIAYYLLNHTSCPEWLAFSVCVAFGGVVNLAYGMIFGPAFARRDPLTKMMGTLGLALVLLGLMARRAPL